MPISSVDATSQAQPPVKPAAPAASPAAAAKPIAVDKVEISAEDCSKLPPAQQLKALAAKYGVPWDDKIIPYKQQGKVIKAIVIAEAKRQGVPENVALAVCGLESGWRMWTSVNYGKPVKLYNEGDKSTDYGAMQINNKAHPDAFPCARKDLEFNIRYGIAYLAQLHDQYGDGDMHKGFGKWDLTMAAYNQGCVPTGPKRKAIAVHYLELCRSVLKHALKP